MSSVNSLISKFTSGEVTEATVAHARSIESTLVATPDALKRVVDDKIGTSPVLHIICLNAIALAEKPDAARYRWFANKFHELVSHASKEQVRLAAREFSTACRFVAAGVIAQQVAPLLGVALLRSALTKLRPSVNHLTPAHAEFVKLCVVAHAHHRALPIVSENLFDVDAASGLTIEDVLSYAYYAGLAFAGARQFAAARRMFLRCMQTPASAPSAIAVEAYKKFVLVSLIADGKVASAALTDLPQALSTALPRVAEAYQELSHATGKGGVLGGGGGGSSASRKSGGKDGAAAAVAAAADDAALAGGKKRRGAEEAAATTLSPAEAAQLLGTTVAASAASTSKLERVALRHAERVRVDGNLGLLKQALAAEQRLDLKRQTKTYLTLSLAAIAQRAGLPNEAAAEELLLQMIEAGDIYAKISARDGMVVFQDVGESFRGPEQLAHINGLIDNVMRIGRNIRNLEHELKLDPALIKKQLLAANNDAAFGGAMALDN